ncbi:TetR family transcriptional regulator [soil metagenome]
MARTGRRPGNVDTRAQILAVARAHFAELGYDGVSLRGIARTAGVDPALLHHYFAGKSALFAEVMQLPVDPAVALPMALRGPLEGLGERLVRFFLGLWESPDTRPQMLTWFRSSLATEEGAQRLREFVTREVLSRVIAAVPAEQRSQRRTALVGAHLAGLGVGRYLIRLGPLAEATVDQLVAEVGPVLQHYLIAPLPDEDGLA